MTNEKDVNSTSTTNIRPDGRKKNHKGKKDQKFNEELLLDPTPREVLTYHPLSITDGSDNELGEKSIDVTAKEV